MTRYEAIDCYEPTYSVWVQLLTYGRRGLGLPAIDFEPKVSGLTKADAHMWALGQAQVMLMNADWKIIKNDLYDKPEKAVIVLEDKLGAQYSIHVALDLVQKDRAVTIKPTRPSRLRERVKIKRSTRPAKPPGKRGR